MPADTVTGREPAACPVFLSYGFRPFFLLAGIYGALALAAWVLTDVGIVSLPDTYPGVFWHGHEMLFGFTGAAACGFLLTAVPNWTGTPPVGGARLGFLTVVWLAGRVAFWSADVWPPAAVAVVDLALIPALAVLVAPPLMRVGNRRNYVFLALLALLFAADLLFHLDVLGVVGGAMEAGLKLALYDFVVMIALIGGRVIPAFTANALARRGIDAGVRSSPLLLKLSFVAMAATIAADLTLGDGPLTGAAALIAALVLGLRMRHWRTMQVLDDPIVWVLHLGYGWVMVGFALKGLAGVSGVVPPDMAVHAFGAGAAGTMVMAMMSRAALGHTGRPFTAPRPIAVAYGLVGVGALLRVAAPLAGSAAFGAAVMASGALWSAAFLIYTVVYWPILTGPRVGGGS